MYEDSDHDHQAGANRGSKLLRVLALGALLAGSWRCIAATHRRRHGGRSARLHERLQTWEGEGGRPDPAEVATDAEAQPVAINPS